MRRVLFPAITRCQARIGTYFHQMPGNKRASGHVSSGYLATSTHRVMFSAITQRMWPSGAKIPLLARPSAHFVSRRALLVTHRGISVIFSFITPWVTVARGIEPEMPLIARRSAHFVTRRLISLPVGPFITHRGILVFFPSITPGMCLHLASKPKCPAHALWSCPGSAKAAGMAYPWLGKEGDHPPLYMHLELFPMWQEETSFRPRSVLAIFPKF
jgi:hypothetical protein